MSDRICRICEGVCTVVQTEERRDQTFTVLRCASCGTVQTKEHYGAVSPDFVGLSADQISRAHIEMGREHKHHAYEQWLGLVEAAGVRLGPATQIVDIGCGTAGFLEFLRGRGIPGVGFDASLAQVKFVRDQGLDAEHATTTEDFLKLRPEVRGTAAVVTAWDVFEHIRDPFPFLEQSAELLAPGGVLYISVPSAGGHLWKRPVHRLVRGAYSFDPWEHVFYYNPRSLRYVLEKAGYRTLSTGGVVCYRRPLSAAEAVRRASFAALRALPSLTPQLYALASR